jgi:hypothetical protein
MHEMTPLPEFNHQEKYHTTFLGAANRNKKEQ